MRIQDYLHKKPTLNAISTGINNQDVNSSGWFFFYDLDLNEPWQKKLKSLEVLEYYLNEMYEKFNVNLNCYAFSKTLHGYLFASFEPRKMSDIRLIWEYSKIIWPSNYDWNIPLLIRTGVKYETKTGKIISPAPEIIYQSKDYKEPSIVNHVLYRTRL